MNRLVFLTLLSAITWVSTSTSAHAYLDPGNGSIILQVILGGIAGLAVGMKYYWQQIQAFFQFGKKHKEPEQPGN